MSNGKMNKELKAYKVTSLSYAITPDSIYYVKSLTSNEVLTYITDMYGVAIPLRDLTNVGGTGITTITSTNGSLTITGTASNKNIQLSNALLQLVNNSVQVGTNISQLINDKGYLEFLVKESAENIPSYTPIAIVDNKAYKFDASILAHKFAFAGFSTNGTTIGQNCIIQQKGELNLSGWGLIPNSQYLASNAGLMVLDNTNISNFTKVIGYATTSDTLLIIDNYTTLIK